MFYDPMICKLITHGPDRDSALDRMRAALDAYVIRGVGHNISFLRALCDHPRFCEGRLSTGFIKEVGQRVAVYVYGGWSDVEFGTNSD